MQKTYTEQAVEAEAQAHQAISESARAEGFAATSLMDKARQLDERAHGFRRMAEQAIAAGDEREAASAAEAEQASELARLEDKAREQAGQVAEHVRKLAELQAAFVDLRRAAADRDEAHRRTYQEIVRRLESTQGDLDSRNYGIAYERLAELLSELPHDFGAQTFSPLFDKNLTSIVEVREAREAAAR